MNVQHATNCQWEMADCVYKDSHHYCPHPEHACNCVNIEEEAPDLFLLRLDVVNAAKVAVARLSLKQNRTRRRVSVPMLFTQLAHAVKALEAAERQPREGVSGSTPRPQNESAAAREYVLAQAMPIVEAIKRDIVPDLDENSGGEILVWLRDFGLRMLKAGQEGTAPR